MNGSPTSDIEPEAASSTLELETTPVVAPPPQRFLFETDATNRLRGISPVLVKALGDDAAYWHGATFQELEDGGWIISAESICEALTQGGSFAGVRVTTPGPIVLDLELGGIPLFDGLRRRVATRGFGVLRTWPNTRTSNWIKSLDPDDGHAPREPQPIAPLNSALSHHDSETFRDIGRTLHAVMAQESETAEIAGQDHEPEQDLPAESEITPAPEAPVSHLAPGSRTSELLDTLPFATILEREGSALHLNRTFLEWTGWANLADFHTAGDVSDLVEITADDQARLTTTQGQQVKLNVRAVETPFLAPSARLLVLRQPETPPAEILTATREQALNLVPWPVMLLDGGCQIRFANTATETLLGFSAADLLGQPLTLGIPPDARGAAIGWIDSVTQDNSTHVHTSALTLRTGQGEPLSMMAGLARMDAGQDQFCLVLGPRQAPAPLPDAAPMPDEAEDGTTALHLAARRLKNSLAPAMTTLLDEPEDDTATSALPAPVADALRAVRQCLSDLASLASPAPENAGTPCDPTLIVEEAITHVSPTARRCRITLRADIQPVPQVTSHPAHVARLVRVMLEEALEATPSYETVLISLSCDEEAGSAPVLLEIADGGPALDEVALSQARAPLAATDETDRFSQAGRPLRYARMAAEADAIGARFSIRRGQSHGMHTLLELPR